MKKICFLGLLFLTFIAHSQNFDAYASGIKIQNTIYNVTGTGINEINPSGPAFNNVNLGSFGQNSTCARISGSEVKTSKGSSSNVCSVTLFWRVYPSGNPSGSYNPISLSTVSDCNLTTNVFNDGFGPCGLNDQKWKDYSINVNFINGLLPGNYTLETFFSYTGSDVSSSTCETTKFISDFGNNFKATFTIDNPICSPVATPTTLCEGDTLTLTANPSNGQAPYTFAWSGPNGFTSNLENPTISNITLNGAGVYNLVVTDACGAISTSQNTNAVIVNPKVDPFFDALFFAICNGANPPILPNLSTNGITGTWNPSVVNNTATGTYIFTPDAGQCANVFVQPIFVINNVTPVFSLPASICVGSTPPILPNISNNGILGTWSVPTVTNSPVGSYSYTFTPSGGQCAVVKTITINVTPIVTPAFTLPTYVCHNAAVPILPTTSNNGITGTWNPSTVSSATIGTFTFTFTPTVPTQCGTPLTITIQIRPILTPTFNPIPPICEGSTPPVLPNTSTNNVTGTWSPTTVSNTTSGTYTFTANPTECATPTTIDIIVNPKITPTFDPIPDVCYQSTPIPILPTTSNEGIIGTWNPAIISNIASGTYTFTPNASECALPITLTVNVTIITPTFSFNTNFCANSVAPILPTTSDNGITGTWNPSVVSNTVGATYTFTPNPGQCAIVTTVTTTIDPNITPTFDTITPICENDPAPILQNPSNNGITGTWNPAVVDNTATGTYTFTPDAGQCALVATLIVTVNPNITPAFTIDTEICENDPAPILPTTSTNGITGTWNPSTVSNTTTGGYTFTPNAGQCAVVSTITITVNPILIPTFDPIPPICSGGSVPNLPLISNNGISGTWNPTTISNTTSGNYTFTPAVGECANPITISITVEPNIIPVFDPIQPICSGGNVPNLTSPSNNGITGTWNPSTINNTTSGTYTFTPDPGQCATVVSLSVTIIQNITPSFTIDTQICENEVAPLLPTTSNNSITGTWNPSTVDNTATGTYTFTPNAGQCAIVTTVTITVNPNLVPTFSIDTEICENDPAPILPLTSSNGISGTWNPAVVNNTQTGTYTFTPNVGQCGLQTTVTITVNPIIIPVFDPIPQICYQTAVPTLPTTSNNGITGTWNPATISNTASGTYTFTPSAGQCSNPISITTDVLIINPTFDPVQPICYGDTAPILPSTSNNGITGTWNPSTISNTLSGSYTFTPNPGQCATQASINVTVNSIVPEFSIIPLVCFQSTNILALPTTSDNGIVGTWNPTIFDTTVAGTYTFTPNPGQCATTYSLTTTIQTITPTFDPILTLCQNSVPPTLATTSNNGITGTWNPAVIDTSASGSYTFTPDANQCAIGITIDINVNPIITPTFDSIPPFCYGTTAPILPTTSNNGIAGTWNPSIVSNTASGTYTFTPLPNSSGICSIEVTLDVVVNTVNPVFDNFGPICYGTATIPSLPTTSNNGITGTWNPSTISNLTSGTYTFTPDANQCAPITTISIDVNTITPSFDGLNSICENETAPILPTTSTNGIIGTWNPAVIDNAISGTYTFTPNPEQCATTFVLNFVVNPIVNPTFNPIPAICYGTNSPLLQSTSLNGVTGTWNPAIISNTASGTYNFTPDAGQCATTTSLTVEVTIVNPVFDAIAPFCENATAPILPTTSNNGITGTWSPSIISNTSSGTYIFTPDSNQCAPITSIDVVVLPNVIPTFNQIPDVCYGTALIPTLPSTSLNGITGTWNPATIDNQNPGTYTFTPNAGQCSSPVTMTININSITPTFAAIPDVCYGSATIPTLPSTSLNGITGTWNPSTIDNLNPGTYTFTPDAEQCATVATLSVGIFSITPTFNPIPDVCYGTATIPTLPTSSNNGITGTWSPALISNTVSNTYTFTPDAEQCATTATLSVNVYSIHHDYDLYTLCYGSEAPILQTTLDDGITGTWSPSVVDNTTSGSYIFTPDPEQCAMQDVFVVLITPKTTPTFSFGTSLTACQGDVSAQVLLPSPSIEGITGTWNPNTIDFSIVGTTVYTFTPNANECAIPTSLSVLITPQITPTFDPIPVFCSGTESPVLPNTSLNGFVGTWNPSVVSNTQSGTYTFTPNTGQCATTTSLNVTVNQSPTDINYNASNVFNSTSTGIIEITGVVSGLSPYQYSINGSSFTSTTIYNNLESGEYTITVLDANGCTYTETIVINSDCMFPNGISPNGDGFNDTLNLNSCNVVNLEIFNRYGTKVNSFINYTSQWDGTTSSGQELPDGTYFYVAQISDGTVKTGWVYVNR
jgi:large repetitive protein